MNKLIAQGAEAKIFLNKDVIIKDRIPKTYRHPQLDEQIRTRRTRSEAKLLTKAHVLKVNIPKVLDTNKFTIKIEYIKGDKLSETLNSYQEKKQFKIMQQLGKQVALLHKNNIIHGDLTTSNIILKIPASLGSRRVRDKVAKTQNMRTKSSPSPTFSDYRLPTTDYRLFLIDFGLGFISTKIEDKAVDLHLIKQALEAKHFQNHENLFKHFLKTYKWKDSKKILERLRIVEKRGRYKH